ncbi:hypothetical protein [Burkholderia oklahomensis]|uniref:Uncharacterized protein n=1 Tax=Burkholderia oklahomensis TaxID=342113 RepID=A0AAI8B4P1_9BURK|nr:hypothetical protein [Burkholderia oklahomensis]AIO65498.1 hypothetical protein DM82_1592 [Burkholderia oklahomensis]AOI42168.1 hypothetical protein WG70_21355 [Burkholderia oklahomensis EO147]KUY59240.1 hypothetical protein WG70_07320 [Burkholderia oklahomensis EO147]QPS36906.1 hypothetical protein I6G57_16700 [Burkholderia oklahomensis]
MSMYTYCGFEIYPLIYPHFPARDGHASDYEAGFDVAVKICLRGTDTTLTRSRTFRLHGDSPFSSAGDARRASLRYAEGVIDQNRGEQWTLDEGAGMPLHA